MSPNEDRKKILIIEDEKHMREALIMWLSRENFRVFAGRDGEEGLQIAFEEKPDLILMDILMPKLNGMKLLAKIRKNPWGSQVPIVVLSNFSEDDMVKEAKSEAVEIYLIKSEWSLKDITAKVKEVLHV